MKTIQEHLMAEAESYRRRRDLQHGVANRLPKVLRKQALNCIWAGGLKHMRHFDHQYGFVRTDAGLSSMTFRGKEVAALQTLGNLIPRIERPVTLVTLGPSAKEFDWEKLRQSDRMIVAVSGGATFLKDHGITPELMIVSDPDFSKAAGYHLDNAAGVPLVIECRAAAALHAHFPQTLAHRRVTVLERVNKWYGAPAFSREELKAINARSGSPFWISEVPDKLGRIGWSDRPELGFFPSSTVAIVALQVLAALGADDIEIVGMDLGGGNSLYTDTGPSRLAEQYEKVLLPSFQAMGRALANREISIRNLSPTCPLPTEIFPKKTS